VIALSNLQRGRQIAVILGEACDLVVEDVGKALQEEQRIAGSAR
jgi:hypothetical protein